MKKFVLVMIAAVMALGMSAFTTVEKQNSSTQLWYYGPDNDFHEFEDVPCTAGIVSQCEALVVELDEEFPIYTEKSLSSPYMKNN